MTTLTQRIEQLDQIRRHLDAARKHFDEVPSVRRSPIDLGSIEHQEVIWHLSYDSSWGNVRVSTHNYRFRSRRYQVEAVVKTEPLRVNVVSVSGETGRATFAQPIRVTAEGDLHRQMAKWLESNRDLYEAAREQALRMAIQGADERISHAIWLCSSEVRSLSSCIEELALDPDLRSVFRQLESSNPEAAPEDLARIASDLGYGSS